MRLARGLATVAAAPWLLSSTVDAIGWPPYLLPESLPFRLSDSQMAAANLTAAAADAISAAVRFERSNWAAGSVRSDPFYTAPDGQHAPPGAVLKVEPLTNTSRYTVAPALALSRIVYQSRALDGSAVPVSAFVLWPYLPRVGSKAPLVAWAHGTSGVFAECAPSHVRNLWAQFSAPYALALAGFAVVGTDYAGLGVSVDDGRGREPITHQYLASPAAANDLLYAAKAAHAAFPRALTEDFVVVGHSQGGAAAWAAAQQQLEAKVPGYLGAIAVAPITNAIELASRGPEFSIGLLQTAKSIVSVLRNVSLSSMLTPAGIRLLNLVEDVQGCNSVWTAALAAIVGADPQRALVHGDFIQSDDAERFANLSVAGGKDFAEPLLVLQGTADQVIPEDLTAKYVNKTCQEFPRRQLHYVKARAMGHDSILYATQQIWLDWLDQRFAEGRRRRGQGDQGRERPPKGECSVREMGADAPRPLDQYQQGLTYALEYAADEYMVA
ncbi:serine aminopeptidase, s33 domain-containing protein [Hirsutella rhossiliensis]|uniref:Serine aminopeptidase, s33 domain-containing protein n=1 Tax=Hirsutella rhossiliensis TaxID=111463 RepID=A0A9P8SJ89_9HYPO|nr:serine aminopeptidase, s33 domain-containing protein [Hirsutella rhossiliensis]KAH0962811.1 serine aminopeptidase, s33 domain-containing protein [Hirsutella rhossiliensis]